MRASWGERERGGGRDRHTDAMPLQEETLREVWASDRWEPHIAPPELQTLVSGPQ